MVVVFFGFSSVRRGHTRREVGRLGKGGGEISADICMKKNSKVVLSYMHAQLISVDKMNKRSANSKALKNVNKPTYIALTSLIYVNKPI